MTTFQQTSVCSFSPFLSVLLVITNILISFLSCNISLQAVVSLTVKEELSFSLTLFFNYYFPCFMLPNSINLFSLLYRVFSVAFLLALCPLQSLATSLTCPLVVACWITCHKGGPKNLLKILCPSSYMCGYSLLLLR